jgi:CheY-like chemotaxis protein
MELKQILVVDDDPEDRAIIKEALEMIHDGEIIMFAENGEQALDVLDECFTSNRLPCLVVLDLNMPKMNGTETLRSIKKSEAFKHIPVIIYSTSVNPAEKDRCLQLGALDYIAKPISFVESKATAQKLFAFCTTDGPE